MLLTAIFLESQNTPIDRAPNIDGIDGSEQAFLPAQPVACMAFADTNRLEKVADMVDYLNAMWPRWRAAEGSEEVSEQKTPMEFDHRLERQVRIDREVRIIDTTTPFEKTLPANLKEFVDDNNRVEIRWRGENLTDSTYDHRIHHFKLLPTISRLCKLRNLCCSNAALFSNGQHIGTSDMRQL